MTIIELVKGVFTRRSQWLADMRQQTHVNRCVDACLERAVRSKSCAGAALYCRLPDEMCSIVNTAWFDPYRLHLNRNQLELWLRAHVYFDVSGEMVVLHDHGEILWRKPGVTLEPKSYDWSKFQKKENDNG